MSGRLGTVAGWVLLGWWDADGRCSWRRVIRQEGAVYQRMSFRELDIQPCYDSGCDDGGQTDAGQANPDTIDPEL